MKKAKNISDRCPYCGSKSPVIWVHGHGQCGACGINIKECCRGEQCVQHQSKQRD